MPTKTATAPAPAKSKRSYNMSDEHKANLAAGREQARVVRDYLTALQSNRPKRGRKRTAESIQKRLSAIEEALPQEENPLKRLTLLSEKEQLDDELLRMEDAAVADVTALETEFVKVANDFSARRSVSYSAWRESGVPASVLKQAGVSRSA